MSEPLPGTGASIQSASDFASTPAGKQARWAVEITAAKKELKKWHDLGRKLVDRFLDKRRGNGDNDTRLNLFSANIQTQRAMLMGKTPRVDVSRRFEDSSDAVGRAAATILQRMLNTHIEENSDNFTTAIAQALDDRLLVGLGAVRVRYEADFEDQEEVPAQLHPETGEEMAPAYTPEPLKTREEVKVDYVHWADVLWSPARTWQEVRWVAFRVYMTKDELVARFGEAKAEAIPFNSRKSSERNETLRNDPWSRAEVYEVWVKENKCVYWFVEGASSILDEKDDPLQLDGFFPCPRPLVANLTTSSFMPRPDFIFAQDLYNEIDYVSTRITLLERAVKVVGVYDKSAEGVRRMLTEGFDNDLIGVDNWAMFAERGGLKGQIDWLPLDQVVAALDKLREYRSELVKLLYEITGMSDIMRGEQQMRETATTSALKAKFASVRLQAAQEAFALFASDILKLKAEIITKHCDDQTIITESNVMFTADKDLAQQAIQLLRDDFYRYRVEVKSENIAMSDFDQLRTERTAYLQGLTTFLQAVGPLIQQAPESGPYLLELLKWGLIGFRGSSTIEAVLDRAIADMQRKLANPPPPQPDPKLQLEQAKAQADIQGTQMKTQADMLKSRMDLQTTQQMNQIDVQKKMADLQLQAQKHAQTLAEQAQSNAMQPAQEAR